MDQSQVINTMKTQSLCFDWLRFDYGLEVVYLPRSIKPFPHKAGLSVLYCRGIRATLGCALKLHPSQPGFGQFSGGLRRRTQLN